MEGTAQCVVKNIWPNKFTFAGSFVKTLEFLICVGKINGWGLSKV